MINNKYFITFSLFLISICGYSQKIANTIKVYFLNTSTKEALSGGYLEVTASSGTKYVNFSDTNGIVIFDVEALDSDTAKLSLSHHGILLMELNLIKSKSYKSEIFLYVVIENMVHRNKSNEKKRKKGKKYIDY